MIAESKVREMYEAAVERAAGYADADSKVYLAYLYMASSLGKILEIGSAETLQAVKAIFQRRKAIALPTSL